MAVLLDSGFLFASLNASEAEHQSTIRVLKDIHDLDFVDALIVAIAERLNITRLLTLDRRDFQIIRPKHCNSFELLP